MTLFLSSPLIILVHRRPRMLGFSLRLDPALLPKAIRANMLGCFDHRIGSHRLILHANK